MSTGIQYRGGTTAQHAAFTGLLRELTVDTDKKTVVVHDGATAGGFPLARAEFVKTAFIKADKSTVVFTKTANGTASIKAGTVVAVNNKVIQFTAATAIVMPTLTAGTDYAIYACDDGTVRADASFTNPTGYTTTNSRQIGGFHYAAGGNAAAQTGGDTTPQINAYSLWDSKFRPACADPRGMTLVADNFWSDIYLVGVDWLTNGTSKYNVTIADGSSPPKIPTKFGGNGSTAYGSMTWWETAEVIAAAGKRLPTYQEFAALAYGTTEGASIGTDQNTTQWNAAYVSKWGCNQVAGIMWQWGDEAGGAFSSAGWTSNTGGRGQTYNAPNAVLFGGNWSDGVDCGSRASDWNTAFSTSAGTIGGRAVCDHLIVE